MPRVGDRFRNVEAELVGPGTTVKPGTVWTVEATFTGGAVLRAPGGLAVFYTADLAQDFEPVAEGRAE